MTWVYICMCRFHMFKSVIYDDPMTMMHVVPSMINHKWGEV